MLHLDIPSQVHGYATAFDRIIATNPTIEWVESDFLSDVGHVMRFDTHPTGVPAAEGT